MKIKVLKTIDASADEIGNKIKTYKAGEIYDIYQDLANMFIKENWGIEHKEEAIEQTQENIEEKAIDELENKAIEQTQENKSFNKRKGK